ncbi:MAG: hypothetical protein J0I65_18565 [Variovorax sp.]|nr:hypothetical protein [Variovorax sp.]
MLTAPLSTPARRVGTVDATRDNVRPVARCLEQCQGHQRSSMARIVPMDARTPVPLGHRLAPWAGAAALVALVAFDALGWLA